MRFLFIDETAGERKRVEDAKQFPPGSPTRRMAELIEALVESDFEPDELALELRFGAFTLRMFPDCAQ